MKTSYRAIEETNLSLEKYQNILCPALRIGVRMGLLNPDSEGWVRSEELARYLKYIGVKDKSGIQTALVKTGEIATRERRDQYANITEYKGTFLDHGSASGILNNPAGFSEHLK